MFFCYLCHPHAKFVFQCLPEFLDTLSKAYSSTFRQVNFATNAETVRSEINGWVAEVTMRRIKDLISPGILNALTRLVIVNAIYFKGETHF